MTTGDGATTSVRFFEELYAVVAGLGLALAAEQIIDLGHGTVPIVWDHVPVFFAYLNLAFALAHSSVRYLQLAYEEGLLGPPSKVRVLVDVVLGVGHFLWLIGMSFVITRPVVFVWFAMALLLGRPARDGILRVAGHDRLGFDDKVARVHLIAIAMFGIILAAAQLVPDDGWLLRIAILVVSAAYGLGLYITAFDHFFGSAEERSTS